MDAITKIPPTKTGIDFLSSSHFTIGNDPLTRPEQKSLTYRSTFQNDYLLKSQSKSAIANIPAAANIMHKDDRIYDQCSVTRDQFVPKFLPHNDYTQNSLTKTNFKMDRDNRIDTFQTTHSTYYTTKHHGNMNADRLLPRPMESHIPQGDPKKEGWSDTSYHSSFPYKLHELEKRMQITPPNHLQTIQGDHRSHGLTDMFNTTSRTAFSAHPCPKQIFVPDHIKYPKTIFPRGEKTALESTHQDAFKEKFSTQSFNRDKVLSKLQKTTFKNGDNRLDCFQTTAANDYSRHNLLQLENRNVINRWKSSILSDHQHLMNTYYDLLDVGMRRNDFKPPPSDYRVKIVDGSDLHSVSKISFGNDQRPYYRTTMHSSFPVKYAKYKRATTDTCSSSIPLNFYDNIVSNSSYRLDYAPTKHVTRLLPNPQAVENLIKSHIGDPIRNFREFKSTHANTYTPKSQTRINDAAMNRGLHRSSVPLGTLSCE